MSVRRFRDVLIAAATLVGAAVAITVLARPDVVRAAPGDPPVEAGVQVDGVGTATGTPDVLRVTVGVETTADSVGQALQEADDAARRVLDALHASEVSDDDVRTTNLSIYPSYGDQGQQIAGYTARHDLDVTLRDVARAGAVIGAVTDAGGDAARVQGISYALDDDAALQEQARAEAFADARHKAEQYAASSGRALGDVVDVVEQTTPSGPMPYAMGVAADTSEAVPLAPGTSTVSVTVQVRWSLR